MTGAWHCHECVWSAFDADGVERATQAATDHGAGHDVYRCEARHAA